MAFLLRESSANAHRIATAACASTDRTIGLWKTIGEESTQGTQDRLATVWAPDLERLVRFLNGNKRGVVILTIHLGSYLLGILRLGLALQSRRFLFLRRSQTAITGSEAKAFAKLETLGIRPQMVYLSEHGVLQLAQGLREGAVAILLYDLPSTWGSTVAVDLLGTKVNWVRGPYDLAKGSNAWMVPFFCTEQTEQHTLVIGRVSEFGKQSGPQLSKLLAVAQQFADAASQVIRTYPEQWHHWNLMGEMT